MWSAKWSISRTAWAHTGYSSRRPRRTRMPSRSRGSESGPKWCVSGCVCPALKIRVVKSDLSLIVICDGHSPRRCRVSGSRHARVRAPKSLHQRDVGLLSAWHGPNAGLCEAGTFSAILFPSSFSFFFIPTPRETFFDHLNRSDTYLLYCIVHYFFWIRIWN